MASSRCLRKSLTVPVVCDWQKECGLLRSAVFRIIRSGCTFELFAHQVINVGAGCRVGEDRAEFGEEAGRGRDCLK